MITPDEAREKCEHAGIALEQHVDAKIAETCASGHWPCVVNLPRDISPHVAELVLSRYKRAGWDVKMGVRVNLDLEEQDYFLFMNPKIPPAEDPG